MSYGVRVPDPESNSEVQVPGPREALGQASLANQPLLRTMQ